MNAFRPLLASLALAAALLAAPSTTRAAESYDNCAGTISSLPATITTQGVWCLKSDLSTSITSGAAIAINTNNVTIDCNDFKLGGLGAGNSSQAYGININYRQNITIRHCNVRGFYYGIWLYGGSGHLVEDNRFDNNLQVGIEISYSDDSVIRRNRVYSTGGYPANLTAIGIESYGNDAIEITDNMVSGVVGTPAYYNEVIGISLGNYIPGVDHSTAYIAGNRIAGLAPTGTGKAASGFKNVNYGSTAGMVLFADNDLAMTVPVTGSIGINCIYGGVSIRGNTIRGFPTGFGASCLDDGGNVSH